MRKFPGDTNLNIAGASDTHSLKEHLRSMSPDAIQAELDERTAQAESTGGELDIEVALVYYEILDEVDPVDIPPNAQAESLSRIYQQHPEYKPARTPEDKTLTPAPRRGIFHIFKANYVAAVVAVILMFAIGTVAFALDLPAKIYVWGKDRFSFGPASGDMRLEQPTEDGFYSLEDALTHYGIETYLPTWMPEQMKLDEVTVMKRTDWTSFISVYVFKETGEYAATIKIMRYLDSESIPVVTFEDAGEKMRSTISAGDIEVNVTENEDDFRASWEADSCIGNIYGVFTESEIERIVKSIRMGGS